MANASAHEHTNVTTGNTVSTYFNCCSCKKKKPHKEYAFSNACGSFCTACAEEKRRRSTIAQRRSIGRVAKVAKKAPAQKADTVEILKTLFPGADKEQLKVLKELSTQQHKETKKAEKKKKTYSDTERFHFTEVVRTTSTERQYATQLKASAFGKRMAVTSFAGKKGAINLAKKLDKAIWDLLAHAHTRIPEELLNEIVSGEDYK